MKSKLKALILVICIMINSVPANVYGASLGDAKAVSTGTFCNGSDYAIYENREYYSNLDEQDYLYAKSSRDNVGTLVLKKHVISMLINNDVLYLLVYRDGGTSEIVSLDLKTQDVTLLAKFDSLVRSISMRNSILYLLKDGAIETIDLSTNKRAVLLEDKDISLFYLSDYDILRFKTGDGYSAFLQTYSFSKGVVLDAQIAGVTPNAVSYTPRTTAPTTDNPYYTTLNIFHQCGYGMAPNIGNCTCYAFGRSYENLGTEPKLSHGDAGKWYDYNRNGGYYPYGLTPVLGAVAVWKSSGAGHVAVVEIIDGDTVVTSESGWQSFYFKTVTRNKSHSNFSASSYYSFQGFIYVMGTEVNSGLPSEMTVSGLYMPDVLCNGSVPELSGSVSYAESINWVWVGILDKATSAIIDSADTNPFSNTYDLTGLLSQLDFDSLENGEYTLSVQGTGGGKYWNMYDKDFIVEDAYAAVNDLTMPSAIAKGSSIELTGNVTSNFLMSWIWVGILDKDTSTIIDSADASIWTNTYDLSELLSQLDFASLENGEYTLSVQGTGGGKYWNMYDKDFTVEDAYATVTNLTMPSTIAQGSSLELTGNVTSNFLMSWIWVGILDKNTNATIDYADTNLWSNTYELTDLLSQLDFASLENGEYTLSVQGTGGGKYWNMYNKDFTVTTPTPEHSHTYEAIVTTPTCTEKGYTTYACRCGNSYVSDYVDAVGHDVGEWKIVAAPTCTEDGSESRSCSRCEYTETRAIDAVGHSYTVTVIAPTCTERGYTTNTCDCGDTYVSNEVPAMGHTEETIPAVVETCIETGLTEGKKCSACGEILVTQEAVPALGHDWKGTACQRCDAARENPFTDVVDGSFYIDPVLWAVENGITSGTSKTTFDPSGLCLRAHVVTFLYRAAGSPVPSSTKNPFTDVKSGDFYYNPVLWAVENGITQGTSKTQFGSTQVCNRAAVVTFLWRAFGSPEPKSTNNPFVDVKSTDFFYKPVLWAVENGITAGIDATHFNPAGACNRAQVVTFLYRAYN